MDKLFFWVLSVGTFLVSLGYSSYFQRPYLDTKEFLFSILGLLSIFVVCSYKQVVVVPKILKTTAFALFGLLIYSAALVIFYGKPIPLNIFASFFEPVLFVGLFYILFRNRENLLKYSYALWAACFIILAVGSYYFMFVDIENLRSWSYIPFMGNTNMAAQFLGLCLPILFFSLGQNQSTKKSFFRYLKPVIFGWIIAILPFLKCRSIALALICSLIFVPWRHLLKYKFELKYSIISFLVISGLLLSYAFEHFYFARQWTFEDHSSADRMELIMTSLEMFKAYPLGVGFDQFSFEFIPFGALGSIGLNEWVYDDNPHNEILRVMTELGVPGLVVLLLGIFYIIKKLNFLRLSQWKTEYRIVAAGLTILAVESVLQFPFQNIFTVLLICAYLALLLYYTDAETLTINRRKKVFVLIFFAIAIGFNFSHLRIGQLYAFSEKKIERLGPLCDEYPYPWRACTYLSEELIREVNLERAQKTLAAELKRNPYNYLALRFFSTTLFMTGKTEDGCLASYLYNSIFQNTSDMYKSYQAQCSPELTQKFEKQNEFQKFLKDRNHIKEKIDSWVKN